MQRVSEKVLQIFNVGAFKLREVSSIFILAVTK